MITYLLTGYLCSIALADEPMHRMPLRKLSRKHNLLLLQRIGKENANADTPEEIISTNEESVTNPETSTKSYCGRQTTEDSLPTETTKNEEQTEQNIDTDGEATLTVDDETTTEIEAMMSEIMEEMANSETTLLSWVLK